MTGPFDKIEDGPLQRVADDLRRALKDWRAELRRLDAIVASFSDLEHIRIGIPKAREASNKRKHALRKTKKGDRR